MLTRREEDIVEMEVDEKNTEILMKWLKGKEGKRDGSDTGGDGNYRDGSREEREITGAVQPSQ